jgi:hypothetical protein
VLVSLCDRVKHTFSAGPIHPQFLELWDRVLAEHAKACVVERRLWSEEALRSLTQYEEYLEAREDMLMAIGVTRNTDRLARELSSQSKVGQQQMATTYSRRPVFVPHRVMDDIDTIYVKHYHKEEHIEGHVNELLCLSCHMCAHETSGEEDVPTCKTTLLAYLEDVRLYLEEANLQDLDEGHPQRRGVANAATRLKPLHSPIGVPGRLTLPLPTRTMLRDLWYFITTMDGDVMHEASLHQTALRWG